MATTGQNFIYRAVAGLIGAAVSAAAAVSRQNPNNAKQVVVAGNGSYADKVTVDFSTDSNAKHGAAALSLTGTTAASFNLTDLTSASSGSATWDGDTTFASFTQLVFTNLGPGDATIAPGASNPAALGLGGTSPTLDLSPGATHTLNYPAGAAVTSSAKMVTVTPAATTTVLLAISGN